MRNAVARHLPWALLAVSIGAVAMVHLFAAVSPYDDAYIIFRYVDNVLGGRGAVYNTGERVLGVSCPLYPIWLLLLKVALPAVDLPVLAARLNAVWLIAAGLSAHLLMRRLGMNPLVSSLSGSAVMLSEVIQRPSLGGMESSLFLALLFGTLLATAAGSDAAAISLSSLASLARPEGTLLLPIVIAARILDPATRKVDARLLTGFAPLALWTAAATWYYGSPIPHSVVAKASGLYPLPAGTAILNLIGRIGHLVADGVAIVGRTASRLAGPSGASSFSIGEPVHQVLGTALLAWLLWRWWPLSGGDRTLRRIALPVFLVSVLAFYALSNPLLMPWYIPLVFAPVLAMAAPAALAGGGEGSRRTAAGRVVLCLLLSSVVLHFIWQLKPTRYSLIAHGATNADSAERLAAYSRSAEWIAAHSSAEETVAAPEIGVLGYRLDRRMLDPCGLVTPEAISFLPVPIAQRGDDLGVISVEFVQATRPDLVATFPVYARRSLLISEWFASAYAEVHREPCLPSDPGYDAVLVFRRRPS